MTSQQLVAATGMLVNEEEKGEDDEDENFQKREKTQKTDNLDYLTRLMKQKTDVSLKMILQFFDILIVQYEVSFTNNNYIQTSLQQNLKASAIRSVEKQLAYLITVTNSLLSFGMPSANSRLQIVKQMAEMGDSSG